MDSDDLYETNSQIGNNIYPTVNSTHNTYISNYKDATLIDDSILDTKTYAELYKHVMYKKNIKSHVYNPQTGNYNEIVTSEIQSADITNNSDISNSGNSGNYGTYINKSAPQTNKSKWKKISTINDSNTCDNDFCICPICKLSAIKICNCINRDSICKNNHIWHIKNNTRVLGSTHKQQQINNNVNNGCILM